MLLFSRKRRIGREIEPDGSQPEELGRTRSWHYCVFNLRAFVELASLGDRAGVNLWLYTTPDGRSLRKAIDWLLPYALGQKPCAWPPIVWATRSWRKSPRSLVPARTTDSRLPSSNIGKGLA